MTTAATLAGTINSSGQFLLTNKQPNLPVFSGSLTGVGTPTSNYNAGIVTGFATGITNSGTALTVPVAGRYLVHMRQLINLNGGGIYFHLRKNGVTQQFGYSSNATGILIDVHCTGLLDMAANDYVEFFYQNTIKESWSGTHSGVAMYLVG